MATEVAQPDTEKYVDAGLDDGIEALRVILAAMRCESVTYDEAAATALELVSFFEAFEQVDTDDA